MISSPQGSAKGGAAGHSAWRAKASLIKRERRRPPLRCVYLWRACRRASRSPPAAAGLGRRASWPVLAERAFVRGRAGGRIPKAAWSSCRRKERAKPGAAAPRQTDRRPACLLHLLRLCGTWPAVAKFPQIRRPPFVVIDLAPRELGAPRLYWWPRSSSKWR